MFDILSKLGEIKDKAKIMKSNIEEKRFVFSDSNGLISVTTNGKKDIIDIQMFTPFFSLDHQEQQDLIKETIKTALGESERFLIAELKEIIPNIPGMNIF